MEWDIFFVHDFFLQKEAMSESMRVYEYVLPRVGKVDSCTWTFLFLVATVRSYSLYRVTWRDSCHWWLPFAHMFNKVCGVTSRSRRRSWLLIIPNWYSLPEYCVQCITNFRYDLSKFESIWSRNQSIVMLDLNVYAVLNTFSALNY